MKYRRKPLVVEAMLVTSEVMPPGGYLVTYPDGQQEVMHTEQFERDFEEIKRERAPRAPSHHVVAPLPNEPQEKSRKG